MSSTMAEGLRLVGRCPRCGGALLFADDAPGMREEPTAPVGEPHLVLGRPRR